MLFAGTFAPRGWAFCDGQLLAVDQNTALFSIVGTTYGGDGRTTFALPDLRGRAPIQAGQGPGLSPSKLGQALGTETVTLTEDQMPAHRHALNARTSPGKGAQAASNYLAETPSKPYLDGPPDTTMGEEAIGCSGLGAPHQNIGPRLAMNFCIALEGIYPSRA